LKVLRNKVLDRLAETLARYKSDRTVNKGPVLDPKHVSSTMMIIDEEHNKVKILCAKNEGLNQHNSTDDTDFLNCWKACMEHISKEGVGTEEDKIHMLDMILKYQRPRITYYLNKLRQALRFEKPTTRIPQATRPRLCDACLQKLPVLRTRSWIDDSGNEFQFPIASLDEGENVSRAALSAQSVKNIKDDVDSIFKQVGQVSSLNKNEDGHLSRAILKQLLPSLFSVWRSPHFQASIKARLRARLQDSQNSERRQHEAFTALKFLCRVYYSVDVFIQAAQSMPIFKSVECILVSLPPEIPTNPISDPISAQTTPLEVAKSLGLYVRGIGWLQHLGKNDIKNSFHKLQRDKCHVHAEVQLLTHQTQHFKSEQKDGYVHPYIGCSKLCCLLCWLLLQVHGAYQVRGTHETIMHRWEIPAILLTEAYTAEYLPILQDFFGLIRMLLQRIMDQPFPLRHAELLAQSSAALSTIETVLDREKAQMEEPQLNMRQVKRDDDAHPLSLPEREVLALYAILFRDFNNIPDPLTSEWLKFGFCYCTSRGQTIQLAKLYIQLAKSGASLGEIARAYEEQTLPSLMRRRGLNSTYLQAKGISFHLPDLEELGIYRLIAEVNHTLSGRFCYCHLPKGGCHPKFETHLSRESDGDYGFHGTNTWERWQLLNFFKHVFGHKDFNARKMQEAKRHPDKKKLEQYLDSLIPNFQRSIVDTVLGEIVFPKLKAGVSFPNGRPPCWCVMHDAIAPEGL
ncbi:hypothetical protein P154DRAFT_384427, partial [Amniculicola lignicola CBS 123094]